LQIINEVWLRKGGGVNWDVLQITKEVWLREGGGVKLGCIADN